MRGIPDRVVAIMCNVAKAHGVSPADILGRRTLAKISKARREAMYAVRALEWGAAGAPPSYPQIGRWFGRDHTTIVVACQRCEAERGAA